MAAVNVGFGPNAVLLAISLKGGFVRRVIICAECSERPLPALCFECSTRKFTEMRVLRPPFIFHWTSLEKRAVLSVSPADLPASSPLPARTSGLCLVAGAECS